MLDYDTAPIRIMPGIYKEGSPLAAKNRYVDGANIRFYNGYAEKIGGHQLLTNNTLSQPARACLQWVANDGTRLAAWGTADKLYVWTPDTLYDVTPAGLPAGNINPATGVSGGYGDGAYGEGYYGGALYAQLIPPTVWTLAQWGEDLIAVRRYAAGSTVYRWQYSAGTGFTVPAAATGGTTPTDALGILVSTLSRTAIILGQQTDPLNVRWGNYEVLNDWVTSDTNSAGNFRLSKGSTIVSATEAQGGHVILTDTAAYSLVYTGTPATFRVDFRDAACGCIGPHASTTLDATAFWMGNRHFHYYDGVVQTLPCDVESYVFDNVNRDHAYKICCGTNAAKGEVIWYYPSLSSNTGEPDSYVACNVKDQDRPWAIGTVGRGAYMDADAVSQYPIAVDSSGKIWQHEVGTDAGSSALSYYLETSELEIDGKGKTFGRLRKIVPNHSRISGTHAVTVYPRNYPAGSATTIAPFTLASSTQKLSVSGRGRSFRMRWSSDAVGADIRLGEYRVEVTAAGEAA